MALDKLVDSAQLDSDLEDVADAIRAKSGGSDPLAFPAGFISEIGSIETGGGSSDAVYLTGIGSVYIAHESGLPTKYVIESNLLNTVDTVYNTSYNTGIEELDVRGASLIGLTVSTRMPNNAVYALKKVNFNNVPIKGFYQAFQAVYGTSKVPYFETALGLNFSQCGGGNYTIGSAFSSCGALKNVTLKPNCLGQKDLIDPTKNWLNFAESPLLTDESLVSIANGLCATYTSKVNLHSTSKTRCQAITGTVSQVTDDSGTYDFFTADANGAVTLADFITNTKGWTIA